MGLEHMARIGIITAPVNETGVIGIAQVQTSAWEVRDGLPHSQLFGFASSLLPNCNVVVLNLTADNANGTIIASNDQKYRPVNLKGGETCIYDSNGQKVYLSSSNGVISINVIGGQQVNVSASSIVNVTAPTVHVQGNLTVSGTIIAQGNITAGTVDLEGHVHTGVQGGSGSTGLPTG